MKGLLLKDFFNLKKYFKTLIIVIIIYSVIFIPQGNSNFLLGMIVLMCSMSVITTISYDEFAKWDKYALTMPITRNEIIMSKYILMSLLILFGSIVALLINIIAGICLNTLNITTLLEITALCISIGFIFASIIIPLLYKFGIERARIIMLIIFLIPTVLSIGGISLLNYFGMLKPDPEFLLNLFNILPYVLPEIVILILITSYFITINIYSKKDF